MQLIKSLRSFGRWLFNIKDEVKAYDTFISKDLSILKVYVLKVNEGIVIFRFSGSLAERQLSIKDFLMIYRKIS